LAVEVSVVAIRLQNRIRKAQPFAGFDESLHRAT
jgi:hypothetical protein